MDFLIYELFGNFYKLEGAIHMYQELGRKLGIAPDPVSIRAHPDVAGPGGALATANNLPSMPGYPSIDLWQGFFNVTRLDRAHTLIGEMIHIVTGAGDIQLAQWASGHTWKPSEGLLTEEQRIDEASQFWHGKVAENCR